MIELLWLLLNLQKFSWSKLISVKLTTVIFPLLILSVIVTVPLFDRLMVCAEIWVENNLAQIVHSSLVYSHTNNIILFGNSFLHLLFLGACISTVCVKMEN